MVFLLVTYVSKERGCYFFPSNSVKSWLKCQKIYTLNKKLQNIFIFAALHCLMARYIAYIKAKYTINNFLKLRFLKLAIGEHNLVSCHMVSPAITHRCSIWFNNTVTSREYVKSFQNKCAQGVLKLRCKPASCALLSDLGWLLIDHLMDNIRFKYILSGCQMK